MYLHLHPEPSISCRWSGQKPPPASLLFRGNAADDMTVKTLRKWGYVGSPSELEPCPTTAVVHEDESQSSRGCWSHPGDDTRLPSPEKQEKSPD